jgi:RNA polymerase sigma-70 factor (ECF subfamily)
MKPGFDIIGQLPALRRYASSLTRDAGDAEDLVQDALVRAYEGRSTFRPGADLRRWLFSVLHNTFASTARHRRAEVIRLDRLSDVAETSAPPAQESSARLSQIREAFMDLPEEQRAVLHLVAVEGLSYSDAAATLGVPVGTVMSRLGRARAALRAFEDRTPAERASHLRIVGGTRDRHD